MWLEVDWNWNIKSSVCSCWKWKLVLFDFTYPSDWLSIGFMKFKFDLLYNTWDLIIVLILKSDESGPVVECLFSFFTLLVKWCVVSDLELQLYLIFEKLTVGFELFDSLFISFWHVFFHLLLERSVDLEVLADKLSTEWALAGLDKVLTKTSNTKSVLACQLSWLSHNSEANAAVSIEFGLLLNFSHLLLYFEDCLLLHLLKLLNFLLSFCLRLNNFNLLFFFLDWQWAFRFFFLFH